MSIITLLLSGIALFALSFPADAQLLERIPANDAVAFEMTPARDAAHYLGRKKQRLTGRFIPARRAVRKSIPTKAPSASPTIYANIVDYIDAVGIYSFTPEAYGFAPVFTDDRLNGQGGSAYSGGIFRNITSDTREAYVWNTDDWSLASGPVSSELVYGSALAVDPATGIIYSCAYDILGRSFEFVTVDPVEFTRTATIASMETWMTTMFFDNNGTMWGFDEDGGLYVIDKLSGSITFKAATGIPAMFGGAAAVDPESGVCFYIANDWDVSLYEVDLASGMASKIYDLENEEEVASIFFLPAAPQSGAPAPAENLLCEFPEGNLDGTVRFTAPLTTSENAEGTGGLNYTLTCNDSQVAEGECDWGETVSAGFTASEEGNYVFSVIMSNSCGDSRPVSSSLWIGKDTPLPVTGLSVVRNGDENSIRWNASPGSVHRGYIIPEEITYRVTRYPDEVVVADGIKATSCVDNLPDGNAPMAYRYSVVAEWNGLSSEAVKTPDVMTGAVFYCPFNTKAEFDTFRSESLVRDGNTWVYSGSENAASVSYNEDQALSAWLVSPSVELEGGRKYILSVEAWCSNDSYRELLSVYISESDAISKIYYSVPLLDKQVIDWEKTSKKSLTVEYTPDKDGIFYIALCACSPRDLGTIYVDNIMLAPEASSAMPVAPQISVALEDELTAVVSVTAPSLMDDGSAIADINRIILSRDGEPVKTFVSPAPGEVLSFTETLEKHGSYYYTAVAYTAAGPSPEATALLSAVEAAKPMSVTSVNAVETAIEGEVTLTWRAPSMDVALQPIQPGTLTYTIYEAGSSEPLAEGITETSHTFLAVEKGSQEYKQYMVVAVNKTGESSPSAASEPIAVGTPTTVPFVESFAGMTTHQLWSFYNEDDYSEGEWMIVSASETPVALPADGDGGMLAFSSEMLDDTAWATTGKIDLGKGTNPRVSFCYFAQNSSEGKDEISVLVDDGSGFKTIDCFSMRDAQLNGWAQHTVTLAAYVGKVVRIRFVATSFRTRNLMLIDRIEINSLDKDIEAGAISAPSTVVPGLPFNITTVVKNNGGSETSDFRLALYRDGRRIDEIRDIALLPGASIHLSFEQKADASWKEPVKYQTRIEYRDGGGSVDDVPGNDESEIITVAAIPSTLPGVSNLRIDMQNLQEHLAWNDPDFTNGSRTEFTENFEFYEPFEIDPNVDWMFVDGDGKTTYGFNVTVFEGQNDPKAFVVLDADRLASSQLTAASGRLYLGAFCATEGASDDWMISPELNGAAQTVALKARSYTDRYGLESFQILASQGGCATSDFKLVKAFDNVPVEWTEYTAGLPDGTRYFAIRYVSADRFAFFVDDVRFTPAVHPASTYAIEGYNVYRFGELATETMLSVREFTETQSTENIKIYNVTVVYDHGESCMSDDISIESGFCDPDSVVFDAKVVEGGIEVTAERAEVTVNSVDGRTVYSGIVDGQAFVPLCPGVYIVGSRSSSLKFIVR